MSKNYDNDKNQLPIGGVGLVVQMDESVLQKRKNHQGRLPTWLQWVLGGICPAQNRIFLCLIPDRKKETFHHWISKFVKPGSDCHTDCHKSYPGLGTFTNYVEGCQINLIDVIFYFHFLIKGLADEIWPKKEEWKLPCLMLIRVNTLWL